MMNLYVQSPPWLQHWISTIVFAWAAVLFGTAGLGIAAGDSATTGTAPMLPTCQPQDFHYAFTECDENGVRWRVQVPKPGVCTGGAPQPPLRAADCGFTCEPGKFLNKDTSECELCPAGTYSLGGGQKFTDWSELPTDFSVASEEYYFSDDNIVCNESLWQPIGSVIRSPGNTCSAKLIYSANLAKQGSVNFTYSLASDFTYFTIEVHNELCQLNENDGGKALKSTGEGRWRSVKIDLDAGLNVITWRAEGLFLGTSLKIPSVFIKSIEVMGLQYTSDCTKCPAGTFSANPGSSSCSQCPANTHSAAGATNCTNCQIDTEYSVPGSGNCTKRQACTEHDYFQIHTPCDENNQTKTMYKWIEPRLCNPSKHKSVQLPTSGAFEACPPCNPGMSISNKTNCDFCPKNQFSDGRSSCQDCPANTAPEYGMTFSYWNELPPNMIATCISTTNDYGCSTNEGWVLSDKFIHTGHGHADDVYLVLDLKVDGFQTEESYFDGKAEELGTISFAFSLECESPDCTLFFLEELKDANVIEYWQGTQQRQEYRYAITTAGKRTFTWAFQKTDMGGSGRINNDRYPNDIAKIFDITVTNTLNGGAATCKECPLGSDHAGCIPCKPGQYIDEKSKSCKQCPEDTYVRASDPVGKGACLPCGTGLKSNSGKDCYSNCHVHLNGKHYDLQSLKGYHSVMSGANFLTEGNPFYNHFNFSLCGQEEDSLATCNDNSTTLGEDMDETGTVVSSWVCRSLMMQESDSSKSMIALKPISLGDTLLGINDEDRFGMLNDTVILQPTTGQRDLKFYYHSTLTTKACPKGRSTIVTLRCDPSKKGNGTLELPTECPSGTCDGCKFHLLWQTEFACPLCTEHDIVAIVGACKDSQQVTTYVWNDTVKCNGGVKLPDKKSEDCIEPQWYSQIPMYVQIAIAAFVGAAILLCAVIIFFWKKNRKLEYKYQKLVNSATGELPAADSCAIQEGEDEDDVQFEDGKKKARAFLNKFKPKSMDKQGLLDGPDMEAFKMKEQPSIMTPLAETT